MTCVWLMIFKRVYTDNLKVWLKFTKKKNKLSLMCDENGDLKQPHERFET